MITRRAFHGLFAAGLTRTLLSEAHAAAPAAPPAASAPPAAAAAPAEPVLSPDLVLGAQTRLAARLLPLLAAGHGGTGGKAPVLVLSPMSLTLSLSIVAMAASRSMQGSMRSALQLPGKTAGDPFAALLGRSAELGRAGSPLTTANALLVDTEVNPYPAMLQGLRGYGVEVRTRDLSAAAAVEAVNGWVKEATHGLIAAILTEPPGRGGLVALNALHFKDAWQVPFDPSQTAEGTFRSLDGGSAPAAFMVRQGDILSRSEGHRIGIELPFKASDFALTLVTNDKPLAAAELAADSDPWLRGEGFKPHPCELRLPRLDLSVMAALLDPLVKLGLHSEPLTSIGQSAPKLLQVTQEATLRWDETGAEAAAATEALAGRGMASDFIKANFDRPFLFAIRHRPSGFVVLAGYVGRLPTAAKAG